MCGLAFLYSKSEKISELDLKFLLKSLGHRGPDSENVVFYEAKNIGFVHTRLAFLDFSENGDQPITSHDGRYTMIFNGEIYNYIELASKLLGWDHTKIKSDTVILLALIETFGLDAIVGQLNGMFSFVVFDNYKNEILVCRDRFGEKPLYIYNDGSVLLISSDIRSFKCKKCENNIDWYGAEQFLRFGAFHKSTILDNVRALKPGTIRVVKLHNLEGEDHVYWDTQSECILNSVCSQNNLEKSIFGIDNLLNNSVQKRLRSDAELGLVLSGGVDSSLIAYYAVQNSNKKLRSYTLAVEHDSDNELSAAAYYANRLDLDHTEVILTEKEALELAMQIPQYTGEPYSDASIVPSLALSRRMSADVKGMLTGDGGDELFCGYNRHLFTQMINFGTLQILRKYRVNRLIASKVSFSILKILLVNFNNAMNLDILYRKLVDVFECRDVIDYYIKVLSTNDSITNHEFINLGIGSNYPKKYNQLDLLRLLDLEFYFQNDILVKVDRSSMAFGLEGRIPFIDTDIVQFAFDLPKTQLVSKQSFFNLKGKYVLRKLHEKKYGKHSFDKKKGFSIPIGRWLRGGLRDWAQNLIYSNHRFCDLFTKLKIYDAWLEHQAGNIDNSKLLFAAINLINWDLYFET